MNENVFYKLNKSQIDAYKQKDVFVLGIETSCDETAVAIVKNGREVVVNLVASQIDIHKRFGGVVPEVASRNHLMAINNLLAEAESRFEEYLKVYSLQCTVNSEGENKTNNCKQCTVNYRLGSKRAFDRLDSIAVTYGGGLIGALMVGLNCAKTLSMVLNIPLVAVNHIYGHIAACYLSVDSLLQCTVYSKGENKTNNCKPYPVNYTLLTPPFIALVVSGGHTELDEIKTYTDIKCIKATADDAAGECFDKVARVLGLPYPGGVEIEKLANQFLAKGKKSDTAGNNLELNYKVDKNSKNFSYSGLKSAVINFVHNSEQKNIEFDRGALAYTFESLAFEQLVTPAVLAAKKLKNKTLVLAGGVSANNYLRAMLKTECEKEGVKFFCPEFKYCTDNAAMIASQGYFNLINNEGIANLNLDADSSL